MTAPRGPGEGGGDVGRDPAGSQMVSICFLGDLGLRRLLHAPVTGSQVPLKGEGAAPGPLTGPEPPIFREKLKAWRFQCWQQILTLTKTTGRMSRAVWLRVTVRQVPLQHRGAPTKLTAELGLL